MRSDWDSLQEQLQAARGMKRIVITGRIPLVKIKSTLKALFKFIKRGGI